MVKSVLFGIIFLFAFHLQAQSFVASVDNNKVAENERFELRFTSE